MSMSFWDLVRGKMNPAVDAKALNIALAPGGFVNEVQSTIVRGTSASYSADTQALEATMAENELVYACIHIKAQSARDPRLIVQKATQRNGKIVYEEDPGHAFRQLLMHPNPLMTEGDLMQAAIVSWDVSNPRRFYCEKEYTAGRLTALYPLNPAAMAPLHSRSGGRELIGYVWREGRDRREYSLDELLIRAAPIWYDPPPLVSALGSVGTDTAQTQTIGTYFANGGIPPLFLKYTMALNDTQRADIRAKWRSIYGGGQAAGDIGVLDANSDVREVGSKLDQLASQTLRSVSESRICMVFGVPPLIVYAYVGLLRATYSNLKEAWAGFWDATMSPAFKEWRDFWTWQLLIEFENESDIRSERVRLAYDMSTVSALQEDVDAIQNRARASFQAKIISQNEARSALGYAAVPGGDEAYYSAAPAAPQGAPPKRATAPLATKASRTTVEKRMQRELARYLSGEYDAAADAVEG
jgi:HK97 family phage portal protein